MNLDVMQTFCDLVDTGSFSRAAEVNGVSQSAVSQQIAKIERDLNLTLLHRKGGVVAPTAAGEVLYKGAREILRRHEQLLGEVHSAVDAVRGVLRIGTIYSVGFSLLEPYIRQFITEHPEVKLHVEYTGWDQIYNEVGSGEMDLAVVACPQKHRAVESLALTSQQMSVILPAGHKLASAEQIDPQQLEGEKFVAFKTGIPTRRHIDRLLRSCRVSPDIVMEFDNIQLIKRAIRVGAGLSILPEENVHRELRKGLLVSVPLRDPESFLRPIAILRRRGRPPGPAERMFLAILRNNVAAMRGN
ncbi:MAG: LysR family transcriptional regulator [Phycisphaerae bacterium]